MDDESDNKNNNEDEFEDKEQLNQQSISNNIDKSGKDMLYENEQSLNRNGRLSSHLKQSYIISNRLKLYKHF